MKDSTKTTVGAIIKITVIIALMAVAIINYDALTTIDVRQIASAASNEIFAALIIVGLYAVKGVLFVIPASLLYLSVGMAFSPLTAVIINMCGIAVEVTITYLFGMFIGGSYVKKKLSENDKSKKLLELNSRYKQFSVFIIRLLPIFPIDFSSLFFGSVKSNFLIYFIFSILGTAPRVILFTILGDTIYDYIPMALIIKVIICLIPVAAAVILVRFIIKKRKQK